MKKLLLFPFIGLTLFLLTLNSSCKKETVAVTDTVFVPAPKETIMVPSDTLHWTLIQYNTLTNAFYYPSDPNKFLNSPDGVKGSCSIARQEYGLVTAQTYDLTNRTIYFKWKSSGSSQFSTVSLFVSRDGLILPDNQTGTGPERLPYYMTNLSSNGNFNGSISILDDTWYYTRVAVTASNYSSTTASGNYDDKGGTVVENKSGLLLNSAVGTIGIYDLDPYAGASCYKTIGELIIK